MVFSVLLLLKYERCWVGGVLKVCGLWKNVFCETGCWGWLCIIIVWVNIWMDLQKIFPKLSLTEKFHAMIQRKLALALVMSLPMFYETVRHLLRLATAADLFGQQTKFFLNLFAYLTITLKPRNLIFFWFAFCRWTLLNPLMCVGNKNVTHT